MISDNMQQLLNNQYHRELHSALQYFAMSSYFLEQDLDGFANFFRVQAEEEMDHAMRQFDYIHEVDGKVTHQAIEAPKNDFDGLADVFDAALAQERDVTKHIHEIVKAALEESDFATHNFFQWFVQEQVEEESTMRSIIAKLKLIDGNTSALYLMNEEMNQRQAGEE